MRKIRIGTRDSRLALYQTDLVLERLRQLDPDTGYEKVIIKTKGDRLLDVALSQIGDKGLFTKELENEILAGNIDMAVHSMKDMPTMLPHGLMIAAVLERENPSDVLISRSGMGLNSLPTGSRVGTSSLRRRAQLQAARPDLEVVDLRGNVDTRIRRLEEGHFDAMILAYAGVVRLGYENSITEELDFLPAVGQGAIAIESRADDVEMLKHISALNHIPTHIEVQAERAFLAQLEGGCQIPVAARAKVKANTLFIDGLVSDLKGTRIFRDQLRGLTDKPHELGRQLALNLLQKGAGEVLDQIRRRESQ